MLNKYCGLLKRVGTLSGGMITTRSGVGNVHIASEISVVEIGTKLLRNPRCTSDLFDLLDPGREACLYVFRHFFYYPVIVGVKYADDNAKYTVTFGQMIVACLQYLLVWPLVFGFSGFCIGLMGGKDGGGIAQFALFWIGGGFLASWLSALLFFVAFIRMKAD